ncbi:alpha/beta hydrolase-fold protein [Pseudalkalibacillus salsuginis]|uniref:alpha/beta hydrolase-fold protein n=1 Tax=Pseudalkalibacillus salsuginis TaxID=2910972 RepID=UPI001F3FB44A|nr:alpha/beta hydrolase-fold protein [Pseudalkalibacillus salsuginis]MCF6411573.1 esterase family protein [Pseudalkalibacillus salsuginis]
MEVALEEVVLPSSVLDREQKVTFLSSDLFNTEGDDCSLLFVQDGEDYLQLGHLKEQFTDLLNQNQNQFSNITMILIPPGTSHERYQFYHPEGEYHKQYLQFFHQELLPFIRNHFIQQGKHIKKMGLLGDSLGATVSLAIALQHPSVWTHLLLQSTAIDTPMIGEVEETPRENWYVYQVYGKHEDGFQSQISGKILDITTNNRKLVNAFRYAKTSLTYFEENEGHLWRFWKEDLKRALTYFAQNEL